MGKDIRAFHILKAVVFPGDFWGPRTAGGGGYRDRGPDGNGMNNLLYRNFCQEARVKKGEISGRREQALPLTYGRYEQEHICPYLT